MAYPTAFLLEVLFAIALGVGCISMLRKRRRAREIAWRASVQVPIGPELAEAVAIYLKAGLVVSFRHRDWCGMGLRYAEDKFIYGGSHDGEILAPSELVLSGWKDPHRREFASAVELVTWLAPHTTITLGSADESQRLTRERLVNAVEFCLRADRSRWPSYAG